MKDITIESLKELISKLPGPVPEVTLRIREEDLELLKEGVGATESPLPYSYLGSGLNGMRIEYSESVTPGTALMFTGGMPQST